MKKLTALFLSLVLVFAFAACSNNTDSETQSTEPQTQQAENTSADAQNETASSGKTLVVYFSASGNTENAAKYIVKEINANLFKLEPKDAYTDADLNWQN